MEGGVGWSSGRCEVEVRDDEADVGAGDGEGFVGMDV